MKKLSPKSASGKPQGVKAAPFAARGPKKTSGKPMGQTGAPWAKKIGRSTGKPQGAKLAPAGKRGGKAILHPRSKASLGSVTKSVKRSKGY